ncbi:MAG: FMN-binding protein [Candidatus Nanopelagicales bacterium]|nr:FMN-binding protein [Candidatus Nanopelagicales bacterium]
MSKFFRSIAPAVALGGAAIAIVAVLDPAIARQGEEDAALASGAMPLATQEPSPELSAPQTVPQADVQAQVTEPAAPQANSEATTTPKVKKKKKKPASSSDSNSNSSGSTSSDSKTAQDPAVEPAPSAAGNQGTSTSASCDNAKEVTGTSAMTPWGPVQVVASVANGKICSAHAIAYPNRDRKSSMINAYAIPVLDQTAGQVGVQFDNISGATYTTNAYRRSLQSVLDR